MTFAIKDNEFICEVLNYIDDLIDIEVEKDDDLEKEIIQISLELPKEAYRKFGPEAAWILEKTIKENPIGFINYFFPGCFDEIDWDDTEEQNMTIFEKDGSLKIVLNICCLIDDY